MRPGLAVFTSILVASVGCGEGRSSPTDAVIDTVPLPDIDNGSCGERLRFTGEYVDWDFDANSCGVFEATFQEQEGGGMATTAPNGRFDLCISRQRPATRVTISNPTAASGCTSPSSAYSLPAIAIAAPDVILAGGRLSAHAFTDARRDAVFQTSGLTFDPGAAQVLVHVEGPPRAVTLEQDTDTAQALNGTWARGNVGPDVFFPNVPVADGTVVVSLMGGAIGDGEIPIAAGTLTVVTVIAN